MASPVVIRYVAELSVPTALQGDFRGDVMLNRRQFVVGAALAGPFAGLLANPAMAASKRKDAGYGPLSLTPDATDGVARLRLPEGFRYRSIAQAGTTMVDGNVTPGKFDGMECFSYRGGKVRLVRNHETTFQAPIGPAAPAGSNPYDPACNGGTTTIEVDLGGNPDN
jgi:secreted PhoX family phosphatase